ncbi:MAG TPA: iron-sulfur cluster assembly accessory protein [Chloroflexota bacterium]|nr:iron-sulfur cluster assembly accessory protein [Chloroflexota bacterium]
MITISDKAAAELRRIVDENDQADAAIRVFVQGACGCGAAHYGMGIETDIGEDEDVLDANGIKLVVDRESAPYLEGAEIDYRDSLMGRGFMIKNPNQAGGCGCGGH